MRVRVAIPGVPRRVRGASPDAARRRRTAPRIRSVDDRLINERAELAVIVEVAGGKELREVDDDELPGGIDPVRAVVRAAPAELADRARNAARADVLDDVETEPEAFAGPERDVAEMVHGHELDALAAQDPLPVELAAVQQHLQEARVI